MFRTLSLLPSSGCIQHAESELYSTRLIALEKKLIAFIRRKTLKSYEGETSDTVHRSRVDLHMECESCGNARFRERK
jgi:hypothetical protein